MLVLLGANCKLPKGNNAQTCRNISQKVKLRLVMCDIVLFAAIVVLFSTRIDVNIYVHFLTCETGSSTIIINSDSDIKIFENWSIFEL